MGAVANAGTAGDIAPWHALSADDVVERLATNTEKGLDAAEVATRLRRTGRIACRKARSGARSSGFFPSSTTYSCTCCSAPRFHRTDAEPVGRRGDDFRCGHSQRAPWIHPGGQGREGAGFHSQHVLSAEARRCAVARHACCPPTHSFPATSCFGVRRQGPGRRAARRSREVPCDPRRRRSWRVGAGREEHRCGFRQRGWSATVSAWHSPAHWSYPVVRRGRRRCDRRRNLSSGRMNGLLAESARWNASFCGR